MCLLKYVGSPKSKKTQTLYYIYTLFNTFVSAYEHSSLAELLRRSSFPTPEAQQSLSDSIDHLHPSRRFSVVFPRGGFSTTPFLGVHSVAMTHLFPKKKSVPFLELFRCSKSDRTECCFLQIVFSYENWKGGMGTFPELAHIKGFIQKWWEFAAKKAPSWRETPTISQHLRTETRNVGLLKRGRRG